MLKPMVGKREHKKALLKINIMATFVKAMITTPLDDLRIEDLCQEIGISKVTFFNYFSSKEQIIEYFIYKWQYDLCLELSDESLKGIDAIRRIYHSVADHPAADNIMTTLMKFYLTHPEFERIQVTDYEYYLFNEKAFTRGIINKDLPEIFAEALQDHAVADCKVNILVMNLISGFYGVAFVSHIMNGAGNKQEKEQVKEQEQYKRRNSELKIAYDNFLDAIL